MEQIPQPQHHREGMQDLMDKAYEEAHSDNIEIDKKEAELRALKSVTHEGEEDDYQPLDLEAAFRKVNKGEPEPDYESIRPELVIAAELPEMTGKTFSEVTDYVVETFADKFYIPGANYLRYIQEHKNKIPQELKVWVTKDGEKKIDYLFLGSNDDASVVISSGGSLMGTGIKGLGSKFNDELHSSRVVLIKK